MTDLDDLAVELAGAVRDYTVRAAAVGWPSEAERVIWHNLDTALERFLIHLDALDAAPSEPVH